jgi:hypothetical protein
MTPRCARSTLAACPARWTLWIAIVSAVLLAGCDNFRERIDFGLWDLAVEGTAPAPDPKRDIDITTTTRTPGSGPPVQSGDLVHLRFQRTVTWSDGTEHGGGTHEAWVWTGWEPDADQGYWGDFGTKELRSALIGRQIGESFDLRVVTAYAELKAPQYAIASPMSVRSGLNEIISQPNSSSTVVLAGGAFAWNQPSWSVVDILEICPASLATRTGTMKQWGHHLNMFGSAYETDRHGLLRWARLTARCASSSGEFQRVLGPIHWKAAPWPDHGLMAWQSTYLGKHPYATHPEDYDFVSIGGKALPATGR